uniref:Uncharacterized protein isoform X2 n=1 Tax=Nicotiana tabacum TaxID=4097 RepID=A0A1S3Z7N1_TOBAC|nr:PREDICTED: uncharacterized protein LOC107783902 isoform X2 [Nicotiana tabacum]
MFQIGAVVYVLIQTFPGNKLWIPTVIIILTGLIKYGERIRALHLASPSRFRESMMRDPDPGPDYAKLMDDYSAAWAANLPATMNMVHEFGAEIGDEDWPGGPRLPDLEVVESDHWPAEETADLYLIHEFRGEIPKGRPVKRGLSDLEVVEEAYYFYEKFKGLIVDLILDFRQRNESRNYFLDLNSTDAFRVIETELNFIFDVLYTKVTVVNSPWGYARRAVSFILHVVAGILVYRWDKRGVPRLDNSCPEENELLSFTPFAYAFSMLAP